MGRHGGAVTSNFGCDWSSWQWRWISLQIVLTFWLTQSLAKKLFCGLDSYSKKQNKNLQESHKTEEFDLGPTGKKSIFINVSAMIIYVEDNPGVAQMSWELTASSFLGLPITFIIGMTVFKPSASSLLYVTTLTMLICYI